jgi:hypothetical protein
VPTTIWLYQSAPNPSDVILSDPTVPRTSGNMYFESLAASLLQFFGSVSAVLIPGYRPTVVGQMISSFGVSAVQPSEIDKFSSQTQNFYSYRIGTGFATANGWGFLGQRAMYQQLLVAPGNGGLSDKVYYVVANGDVTIPAAATNVSLKITLFQNYFYNTGEIISDPLSVVVPAVTPGQTARWSIVCRLSGNGRLNGILIADTMVNGQLVSTLYSNRNPNVEPKLQLSVGVNLTGSAPTLPQVRMKQFEIQQ